MIILNDIWDAILWILIGVIVIICIIGIIEYVIEYYGDKKKEKEEEIRYKEESLKLMKDEEYLKMLDDLSKAGSIVNEVDYDIDKLREAINCAKEKFPDIVVSFSYEIYGIEVYSSKENEIRKRVLGSS